MFTSLQYIGWSDASIKNDECYVAYGIKQVGETNFIYQETFKVYDINTVVEAEYLAAYLMVRRAIKEGLENIIFYTDCIRVWRDIIDPSEGINWVEMQKYKKLFCGLLENNPNYNKSLFLWEVRKANLAHKLFEDSEKWSGYTVDEIISENYSNVITHQELLQHIKDVEGTEYQILSAAHKDYFFMGTNSKRRGVDEYDFNKIDRSLMRNISEASLYEQDGQKVLVKGKLHMYLMGTVIVRVALYSSELSEKWRIENAIGQNENKKDMKFKLKNIPSNQIMVPINNNMKITKAALMKLSRANLLDYEKEQKQLLKILKRIIKLGKVEQYEGFSVYHYGDCHMQVQGDIIADLKIAA